MLHLVVELESERWDEKNEVFVEAKTTTLQLEHSLVSLSKWESKWCKPFISTKEKTYEQTVDYIKCMTITQNVKPEVYEHLTRKNIEEIDEYINAPMTATFFSGEENKKKTKNKVITSEIIYHWMIALNIPMEFHKWHLNRLITLIKVCSIENQPPKKRSNRDTLSQYAALNAARRAKLKSKG